MTHDGHRLRSIRCAFMLIGLIEGRRNSMTGKEIHRLYRDNVGWISKRTISRYLQAFVDIGIVEKLEPDANQRSARFRWVGWPPPIH